MSKSHFLQLISDTMYERHYTATMTATMTATIAAELIRIFLA